MKKYLLVLIACLFLSSTTLAEDSKRPNLFGIELGSTVKDAAKACRKAKGVWYASRVNLFSCRAHGFSVSLEANGNDVLYNLYANIKQVNFFNKELKKFIAEHENVRTSRVGANSTVVNEFNQNNWAATFMSFGDNGNYTAHLYNVKEILSNDRRN